jgi:hypothetical protein
MGNLLLLKKSIAAWCLWIMPVTLVTQEVEIRRIMLQSQPEENSFQDPVSKKNLHKKRAGGVTQVVGPEFKHQYCNNNNNNKKKKKKKKNCKHYKVVTISPILSLIPVRNRNLHPLLSGNPGASFKSHNVLTDTLLHFMADN